MHQRCFHHEFREAASRCPICQRYFCRECVTEHEDRVICAECLKRIVAAQQSRGKVARRVLPFLAATVGLLIAWLCFYTVGRTLLMIPVSVHDGTVWSPK